MNTTRTIKSQFSRWMPMLLSMALIFILSMEQDPYRLLPIRINSALEDWIEFFGHFLEYTLLGFASARALGWQKPPAMKLTASTFTLCILYALSDEIHQYFVPQRTFQIHDLLVDSAGILVGIALYHLIRKRQAAGRDLTGE